MAKVLLVEDDPDMLLLIEPQLQKAGHHVKSVTSGADALALLAEKTPEIMVLDVTLPDMTGFELLELFRKTESLADIPAIFLTAKTLPEDIQRGRDLGAVYLTKPYVRTALLAAIERAFPEKRGEW